MERGRLDRGCIKIFRSVPDRNRPSSIPISPALSGRGFTHQPSVLVGFGFLNPAFRRPLESSLIAPHILSASSVDRPFFMLSTVRAFDARLAVNATVDRLLLSPSTDRFLSRSFSQSLSCKASSSLSFWRTSSGATDSYLSKLAMVTPTVRLASGRYSVRMQRIFFPFSLNCIFKTSWLFTVIGKIILLSTD